MSELDLDAIEARAAAATPAPWSRGGNADPGEVIYGEGGTLISVGWEGDGGVIRPETDGEFIAHARQDVPALVAEVRRLREALGRVEELADAWNETPDYAPSHYDRGRVEQRHDMTGELLTILGR
jgi:hypothetical protein